MRLRCITFLVLSALQLNALWAGANEWVAVGLPAGGYMHRLFTHPIDPNTVYATDGGDSTSRGILKSTNGGASWHAVPVSYSSADVTCLVFDSHNNGLMYAGTWGRGVFKSTDGGESWQPTGLRDAFVDSVAVDARRSGVVYASLGLVNRAEARSRDWGIYKSIDGGVNWTNLGPAGPLAWSIQTLVVDPKNSDTLYAGDGGCCSNGGLYKTTDAGETWSPVREMSDCYMVDVVITKQDPAIQYAAGSCEGGPPYGKVFRSTDAGRTWTDMNSGLPENRGNIWGLVVDPDHPQILYATFFPYGVFRSVDGGANWVPFNNGLQNLKVVSLALAHGKQNTLFAITEGGLLNGTVSYQLFKVTDTSVITTDIHFDPTSVRAGSSFTATFSGMNLTDETYFDIRFRSPGNNTDQSALNWQRGLTATHAVPIDANGGTWIVTGARAHQDVDDHVADYALASGVLALNRLVVSSIRIDAAVVHAGGSITVMFTGTNLTGETYFDVRFRSPGSNTDQVALNWQQGTSARHDLPSTTPVGTWAITGVWAHQTPNDHSNDFAPVSVMFAIIP